MEEQKRRRERKSAAYWLSKSSILYPICILYVMYVKQVEVYITECSVHISSGTMLFICPIFTENCVVSCSAGWDISCYGFKRFT